MRRRKFITLAGSAAIAWPLAARAQQPERMRRIGVLIALSEGDPEARVAVAALQQGLDSLRLDTGAKSSDRVSLCRCRPRPGPATRKGFG